MNQAASTGRRARRADAPHHRLLHRGLRQGSPTVHQSKTSDCWLDHYVETTVILDPQVRWTRHNYECQRGSSRGR